MDKKSVITQIKEIFFQSEEEEKEVEKEVKTEETETEDKFADYKTAEGKILRIEGEELASGLKIQEVTEEGLVDVEDGEYSIEDLKLILIVKDSAIEEVQEMEEEVQDEVEEEAETEEKEEEEKMSAETEGNEELISIMKEIKTQLDELKFQNEELKKENEELNTKFNAFSNEDSTPALTKKVDFTEMSKMDKMKFYSKKR